MGADPPGFRLTGERLPKPPGAASELSSPKPVPVPFRRGPAPGANHQPAPCHDDHCKSKGPDGAGKTRQVRTGPFFCLNIQKIVLNILLFGIVLVVFPLLYKPFYFYHITFF